MENNKTILKMGNVQIKKLVFIENRTINNNSEADIEKVKSDIKDLMVKLEKIEQTLNEKDGHK